MDVLTDQDPSGTPRRSRWWSSRRRHYYHPNSPQLPSSRSLRSPLLVLLITRQNSQSMNAPHHPTTTHFTGKLGCWSQNTTQRRAPQIQPSPSRILPNSDQHCQEFRKYKATRQDRETIPHKSAEHGGLASFLLLLLAIRTFVLIKTLREQWAIFARQSTFWAF